MEDLCIVSFFFFFNVSFKRQQNCVTVVLVRYSLRQHIHWSWHCAAGQGLALCLTPAWDLEKVDAGIQAVTNCLSDTLRDWVTHCWDWGASQSLFGGGIRNQTQDHRLARQVLLPPALPQSLIFLTRNAIHPCCICEEKSNLTAKTKWNQNVHSLAPHDSFPKSPPLLPLLRPVMANLLGVFQWY